MANLENAEFTVLLVEDDKSTQMLIRQVLIQEGYEVVTADNGKEALELFIDQHFPIVVTDWTMPVMDGLELCKAIRSGESAHYTYIIFLTGKEDEKELLQALEAGADEYLIKPFIYPRLKARLKTAKRILRLIASNRENRRMSITDPLTGSFNRMYLTERLPQEIARARRYGHPLSVILIDIDHFKRVNDSLGHLAGDHVLKEFVEILQQQVRTEIDWVNRFGGEEFLVVLPETSVRAAMALAERIRVAVETAPIRIKNQKEIFITASLGVAALMPGKSDTESSFDLLIDRADQSLYKAKQFGRNSVVGPVEEIIV